MTSRREAAHPNHHRCPGGCGRCIPNHLCACRPCWRRLPRDLQRAICATVREPLLSAKRTAAFTAATTFYATCRNPHADTAKHQSPA